MQPPTFPAYVGNRPFAPNFDLEVLDKATGQSSALVTLADRATIDRAIALAVSAREPMARLASFERQAILEHCVAGIHERKDELANILCIEAGKPIRDARGEVQRLLDTFKFAAAEAVRFGGEVMPMDISERARGYSGHWKRVPVGPCSFITPFNFPLNLVAHKVAPALAVGCPFVLKPASLTPVSALILGDIMSTCDLLPEGAFSILPCPRDGAELFTTDERLKLLSFTGSPTVGWDLKARAGKKKVVLELGGNAAVIVDEDADLDDAVARIVIGAFSQSGQSCVGVQRIFAHAKIYSEFVSKLISKTKTLKAGDPKREDTAIGPLISEKDAVRLETWIAEATARGARVLVGGKRQGALLEATLLENVPANTKICAEEAFGPVAVLAPFTDFNQALEAVNASTFGLQAGVFTRDLYRAQRAFDRLEVGTVVIGDVPSFRIDHMPYGGVKDSGLGREGVRFAMEAMSEIRLLLFRTPQT